MGWLQIPDIDTTASTTEDQKRKVPLDMSMSPKLGQVTLSPTVSKINAFLHITQKLRMARGRHKWL